MAYNPNDQFLGQGGGAINQAPATLNRTNNMPAPQAPSNSTMPDFGLLKSLYNPTGQYDPNAMSKIQGIIGQVGNYNVAPGGSNTGGVMSGFNRGPDISPEDMGTVSAFQKQRPDLFQHKSSWLQKADPYITAAGMGALTFGAGLGAAAGGAGAASSGTSDLVAEHMLMTGAAGGLPTTAGLSGAGVGAGVSAGGGAAFSGMEGTGGGIPAAGAGAAPGGGGVPFGAGDMGSGAGASTFGNGAADFVMPGADAAAGGATGGIGGASSGGVLSQIGSALNQGSAAKNIATYGPVIWSGIEYANAKDAAAAYQDQLQKNIASSDPFGPERAKYQQQLDELMKNPQSFLSSPQVQFASDAAARKMASMGYNQSPAQAQAIADASIGQYYNQANLLSGLSGSQISPNSRAANDAASEMVNSKMGTDAAGGNLTRQLIDSMFSTGSSGKSGSNGGDSGTKVGDRAFSYLDKLV